jgi:hypothetical protein
MKPHFALVPFVAAFYLARAPLAANAAVGASPANIQLWDTGTPLNDSVDLTNRDAWRKVPSDLLRLEANPSKASSDPGYYGQEYIFRGDTVVENAKIIAVLSKAGGKLLLYSKPQLAAQPVPAPAAPKILELCAAASNSAPATVIIQRNSADDVVLELAPDGNSANALVFCFDRAEIVYVRPRGELKVVRIRAPVEYAVLPSFIGDDLIFGPPGRAPAEAACALPADNFLVGLLSGESSELVMTWPVGNQRLSMELGSGTNGHPRIESLIFNHDGRSFCVAPLTASGIWHRENLGTAYLEKEVASAWKRPFNARWKTLLYEEKIKTTFAFRETKGEIWRGVPGSYDYPVWFEGDQAFYHLSKKIPPKGESLVYFLEGQGTPSEVVTPADVLKASLGRAEAEPILDYAGRKLRTHHRRGGDGVHRACTCGCTEAIQAVFESHEEVKRRDEIQADLADMIYFVHAHVDRINEYQQFAGNLIRDLDTRKAATPGLNDYLADLRTIVEQIPQEFEVQRENMKSFPYADELVKRTMALTQKDDANNLKAYMDLLKEWRAMGGAQDYVLAQCHTITRKLAQEAGYRCAGQPQAVSVAKEIRGRAREILRNPDGYEIWADY